MIGKFYEIKLAGWPVAWKSFHWSWSAVAFIVIEQAE